MRWRAAVNDRLRRATGHELRRIPASDEERAEAADAAADVDRTPRPGDRLVTAPTFVLCSIRSGSTLLRVLLNSHSQVHAPHELHLRFVEARLTARWSVRSMRALDVDAVDLQHLLWDRILHRELTASGKRVIVEKTPNNVFIVDRIAQCWPDARFIMLLRHPATVAASRQRLYPDADPADSVKAALRYCRAVERARQRRPGLTIRYEDLTADPAAVTRQVCAFLGVAWEPQMLDYGGFDHGEFRAGIGDWAEKIKTGAIQPAEPPPPEGDVPEPLRKLARAWGYLPGADGSPPQLKPAAVDRATGA